MSSPAFVDVEDLWLDRAAVQNWSRLTGRTETVSEARFALLDRLRAGATLSTAAPEWMTSPKPGVDAWIELDDHVTLMIRSDPQSGRRWRAVNCVTPRRGRRSPVHGPVPTVRSAPDPALIEQLSSMRGAELAAHIAISQHCRDRLTMRGGVHPDQAGLTLDAAIRASGRVVAVAPGWADGAGYRGATLLCCIGDDELALPLQANHIQADSEVPLIATTCIAYSWARADLPRCGASLASAVRVSQRAARRHLPRAATADELAAFVAQTENAIFERGRAYLDSGSAAHRRFGVHGPHIILDEMCLKLRPAGSADRSGARWFVQEFVTAAD